MQGKCGCSYRVRVWKIREEVSVLTKKGREIIAKFKCSINNGRTLDISSLKTIDKTKIKDKVRQIKGNMHNIIYVMI